MSGEVLDGMNPAGRRILEEIAALRRDLDAHLRAHARSHGPFANPADREAARTTAERFVDDVRQALEELEP
jgi:hypothetical protein